MNSFSVADPALSLEARKRLIAKIFGESYDMKVSRCNGCGVERLVIAFDNVNACETCACGDCLISTVAVMFAEGGYRPMPPRSG